MNAGNRTLCYLKGSPGKRLLFLSCSSLYLVSYCDTD
ncbi:unnamed protein product [Linum tenue]|uniref:Uncharacterized protein n=1 Tax=Linum tenue TaxID=586396 RepID=A0AAV0QKK6_9ROSI|nr:unnamed protein product [Linum tenue]